MSRWGATMGTTRIMANAMLYEKAMDKFQGQETAMGLPQGDHRDMFMVCTMQGPGQGPAPAPREWDEDPQDDQEDEDEGLVDEGEASEGEVTSQGSDRVVTLVIIPQGTPQPTTRNLRMAREKNKSI